MYNLYDDFQTDRIVSSVFGKPFSLSFASKVWCLGEGFYQAMSFFASSPWRTVFQIRVIEGLG